MARKSVVTNRQAHRDFDKIEQYEAGIVLSGGEVKSLRSGKASLQDSYCKVDKGEISAYNFHISPYEHAGRFLKNPKRPRKLLLHKKEIERLFGKTTQRGLTLVPLEVYFNEKGLAKMSVALVKKRLGPDKREKLRERDRAREQQQDAARATKRHSEPRRGG
ncbi:MAG: SsrA-binding protein SmpB [Elusimicrobiota bacterium]